MHVIDSSSLKHKHITKYMSHAAGKQTIICVTSARIKTDLYIQSKC